MHQMTNFQAIRYQQQGCNLYIVNVNQIVQGQQEIKERNKINVPSWEIVAKTESYDAVKRYLPNKKTKL